MTNDNNTTIDTTNVTPTSLNVVATDATVTTAGTITASTAATTTTTLPVGNAADETGHHSLFGAGLYHSLSWGQLVISSPQLGGVFRSGPVWPGPSHPVGPCGTMSPGAILAEPGNETKACRSLFPCGNCQGSSWAVVGAVLSGFGRKGTRGQVAYPWPILCNQSARAVIGPSLYKYIPWGRFLGIIFPRESPEEIVRQKRERVAGDLKSNRVWWCLICSDQTVTVLDGTEPWPWPGQERSPWP
ncbi:hypothetical protein IGI04_025617 [Brassica rapa subsp. trilocularis]|uniref:Uncharacterized protein n=1 Tax=Brassica rapa subsp. trilocularis TaxID=1813537 RepID=A0ABQ7KTL9_BRACM|nr:hypothetical protein IGI04_025617 [Brassica rapa subsp. trilocularis]